MPKNGGDLYTTYRKTRNTFRDVSRVLTGQDPLSLKRRVGVYPPQVRDMVERIGGEPVTSLVVTRAPLQSFVRGLMNVISWGTYEQAVRSAHYDQMFHLAIQINNRYVLDKQAVVTLQRGTPPPNAERMIVHLNADTPTIRTLLDRTRDYMGPERFSTYHPRDRNCQDFILATLQANGLLTPQLSAFIKQDADAVFRKLPGITQRLSSAITDVGAVADRIVSGENIYDRKMPPKKTPSPWLLHVKSEMAKHPSLKLKEVLQIASKSYRKKS